MFILMSFYLNGTIVLVQLINLFIFWRALLKAFFLKLNFFKYTQQSNNPTISTIQQSNNLNNPTISTIQQSNNLNNLNNPTIQQSQQSQLILKKSQRKTIL